MSPESLIEKLESLGTIDAKILKKLRKQIADPEKSVSVNKILSFLVKNNFLSKSEALQLKNAAKTEMDRAKRQETDDLLAGVMDPTEVTQIEVAEFDDPALEIEDENLVDDAPTMLLPDQPVVEDYVHDEALIISPEAAAQQFGADPLADPIADPISSWDDSMPTADTTSTRRRVGFEGKINAQDQWATKWVYIGFGALGLLLVVGTLLVFMLSLISAEDRFEAANNSFENGTYGDAIKKFEEFLDKHGSHEKAPLAKVKLVQALLADTFRQKNWDETIARAEKKLPPLIEDDTIDLEVIRQDLAVMLPTSTLEMARRATKQEEKSALIEQLAKAKNAKKLVDNPVYIPNSRRKQATVAKILDNIEEEIAKGDGLIRKQDEFESAMSQITVSREKGETDKAFAVYNELIRTYGDLRANEQLQMEMRLVSQLEAQLVAPVEPDVATTADFRSSPIDSSIVLASMTGSPIESLMGEVIPVLADGSVYGINIGSGNVLWRIFVGYQTSIQPFKTDPDNILVADQANHDLLLVKAADGTVVWRDEIGENFLDPQVDEKLIYLTTESGKLMKINLTTGHALTAVKIPQNTNVPMTRSSRSGLIYQLGFYSNLYVLSDADLSCKSVFYLGHYRGSVSAPPVVWNNFILIAVNQSGVCDLNILHPNVETGNLELVQRIRRVTRGIVTNPLIRFGRFMLINSESGDLKILEINTAEESTPIRILAEEKFGNRDNARTHLTTAGSQLWIGSKGLMRYKVSGTLGTFEQQEIVNPNDYFIGPILKIGDSIVHVRKRSGSALSSISAVDAESLKQTWRTDVGGPLAGPPVVTENQIVAVSSQGDLFSIAKDASGNRVVSDAVKSSNIVEDLLFDETIELSDTKRVCLGPPGRPVILYVDIENGSSKLIKLPAPADKAACRAITIAGDLIIPSRQGQIVRVDPKSGQIVGTPFLPAVSPGTELKWQKPALLGSGLFSVGAGPNLYLIDASDQAVLRNVHELAMEGELKSSLTAFQDSVYAVYATTKTEKIVAVAADGNELTIAASLDLTGRSVDGPWVVNDQILLRMDSNQLISFDAKLNQNWSVDIGTGTLADQPLFENNVIKLFFSDGKLLTLSADTGNTDSEFNVGQPIVHRPVFTDGQALFSGLDGTIHRVQTSQ